MSLHFPAGPGVSLKKQGPIVKLRKPPLGSSPWSLAASVFWQHLFLELYLPRTLHSFFSLAFWSICRLHVKFFSVETVIPSDLSIQF